MDETTLSELLECSVCMETLDETSKILPCQHTFCRRCLEEISATKGGRLHCPECRRPVGVPIDHLPPNILLVRLLESLKTSARTSRDRATREGRGLRENPSSENPPRDNVRVRQEGNLEEILQNGEALTGNHPRLGSEVRRRGREHNMNALALRRSNKPCARALYTYRAQEPGDLSFQRGDLIELRRQIDENWLEGSLLDGHTGYFPANYVNVLIALPSELPTCRAMFDFILDSSADNGTGTESGEVDNADCLQFEKDDILTVIRRVDENWAEGRLGDRIGIFPLSFVQLNDTALWLLSSQQQQQRQQRQQGLQQPLQQQHQGLQQRQQQQQSLQQPLQQQQERQPQGLQQRLTERPDQRHEDADASRDTVRGSEGVRSPGLTNSSFFSTAHTSTLTNSTSVLSSNSLNSDLILAAASHSANTTAAVIASAAVSHSANTTTAAAAACNSAAAAGSVLTHLSSSSATSPSSITVTTCSTNAHISSPARNAPRTLNLASPAASDNRTSTQAAAVNTRGSTSNTPSTPSATSTLGAMASTVGCTNNIAMAAAAPAVLSQPVDRASISDAHVVANDNITISDCVSMTTVTEATRALATVTLATALAADTRAAGTGNDEGTDELMIMNSADDAASVVSSAAADSVVISSTSGLTNTSVSASCITSTATSHALSVLSTATANEAITATAAMTTSTAMSSFAAARPRPAARPSAAAVESARRGEFTSPWQRPACAIPTNQNSAVENSANGATGLDMRKMPKIFEAVYPYEAHKSDELSLVVGQYYTVSQHCAGGWYRGCSLNSGHTGIFPGNYVRLVQLVPVGDIESVQQTGSSQPSYTSPTSPIGYQYRRARPITNITQAQLRSAAAQGVFCMSGSAGGQTGRTLSSVTPGLNLMSSSDPITLSGQRSEVMRKKSNTNSRAKSVGSKKREGVGGGGLVDCGYMSRRGGGVGEPRTGREGRGGVGEPRGGREDEMRSNRAARIVSRTRSKSRGDDDTLDGAHGVSSGGGYVTRSAYNHGIGDSSNHGRNKALNHTDTRSSAILRRRSERCQGADDENSRALTRSGSSAGDSRGNTAAWLRSEREFLQELSNNTERLSHMGQLIDRVTDRRSLISRPRDQRYNDRARGVGGYWPDSGADSLRDTQNVVPYRRAVSKERRDVSGERSAEATDRRSKSKDRHTHDREKRSHSNRHSLDFDSVSVVRGGESGRGGEGGRGLHVRSSSDASVTVDVSDSVTTISSLSDSLTCHMGGASARNTTTSLNRAIESDVERNKASDQDRGGIDIERGRGEQFGWLKKLFSGTKQRKPLSPTILGHSAAANCVTAEDSQVFNVGQGSAAGRATAVHNKSRLPTAKAYRSAARDPTAAAGVGGGEEEGSRAVEGVHSTDRFMCIADYPPHSEHELGVEAGDVVMVTHRRADGWFYAVLPSTGQSGLVPSSFLQQLHPS